MIYCLYGLERQSELLEGKNMNFKELPERLDREVIYESDYVCLYADKVKLPNGHIIEKYHQIYYPNESVSIVVFNEENEVLLINLSDIR